MVRIARAIIAGRDGPTLVAQVSPSSFQSTDVLSLIAEKDISSDNQFVILSSIASTATELLASDTLLTQARQIVDKATSDSVDHSFVSKYIAFSPQVRRILAPIDATDCGKFICIGMNYVDHCTEQNAPIPTVPLVFNKFGSSIVGPGDGIPLYGPTSSSKVAHGGTSKCLDDGNVVTSKLDFEVELGIVIGRTVPRFTPASEACDYIGGYTVIHDVSARDLQLEANGGQWLIGKCGDGYAPTGPVITTLDEFNLDDKKGGAGDLQIECRLNAEAVQSSSTSNLVFSTPEIVSYLSKFITLEPGDIIATGTPPGVGCFRKPQLWLKTGDVVECEIEGIGTLRNTVVDTVDSVVESPESVRGYDRDTPERSTNPRQGPPYHSVGLPSKQRLKDSVCVVTGGARGLGYGIALRLAAEGAKTVVLLDMKQQDVTEAASQLEKELGSALDSVATSGTFHGLACDVTDHERMKKTFDHIANVISPSGRIDILVQAAGIVGETNLKTHEVKPSNFDAVMNVNVKGILYGCQAALPYMLEQKYGRIVNIASIAGKEGNAGMLAYSTSKAAVIGLTKTIGKEYALEGITCNCIAPAVVKTKMVADMPPEQVRYMTEKIPMKRCGKVEEIAALVAYAVSEEAGFTTGFCFDATGGRSVY